MRSKIYFLAIAIGIIAISSCKKLEPLGANNKPVIPSKKMDTDVYVAGYFYALNGKQIAVYWKNGVIHRLSDSTTDAVANAIGIKNGNIYVSGTITNADKSTTAVYWLNGTLIPLDHNAVAASGEGIAFSPCGCEVYIAGTLTPNTSHYKPVYWKDGIQQSLQSNSAIEAVNGITVHGSDIYTTGVGITTQHSTYAIYWKNGTQYDLTDTLGQSQGNAIAVQGSDIYVSGESSQSNDNVIYWKNGTQVLLHDPAKPGYGGVATGIAVNSSNVYVSAVQGLDASYWVNDTLTYFSNNAMETTANSITLYNSDAYVAGAVIYYSNSSKPVAAYWKNGTLVALPTPNGGTGLSGGSGLSIAVTAYDHY